MWDISSKEIDEEHSEKWLYAPFSSIDEWKSCYCYVTVNNNT